MNKLISLKRSLYTPSREIIPARLGRGGHAPGGRGARVSVPVASKVSSTESGSSASGGGGGGGGGAALDWQSDVANSTTGGITDVDILDTVGHAAKWTEHTGTGDGKVTVANAPAGGPTGMTKCWACTLSATARMCRTVGMWTSPIVGDARWFRTEMRFAFLNGIATGSMHPIQVDAFADLHYTWKMISAASGFVQFRIHLEPLVSSAGAFDLNGVVAVDTWYELEWELFRPSSGVLRIRTINIRNMAGTIVATIHDFINANDGTTRFDAAGVSDMVFTDATVQDYWQGNNGPLGCDEGPQFYFGGTATLLNASCGRYSAGRG